MKKILIVNGSLGQEMGNTQFIINHLSERQFKSINVEVLHLHHFFHQTPAHEVIDQLKEKLTCADGFLFTTGTYWDSWGSPMQMFLERITELESSDVLFGKPAAVIVTMHSVGGKAVLSRLQGVLNTMGLFIPPMSGLVYSLASKLAIEKGSSFALDFWSLDDLTIVAHNLVTSLEIKNNFISWPVDKDDPKRLWIDT